MSQIAVDTGAFLRFVLALLWAVGLLGYAEITDKAVINNDLWTVEPPTAGPELLLTQVADLGAITPEFHVLFMRKVAGQARGSAIRLEEQTNFTTVVELDADGWRRVQSAENRAFTKLLAMLHDPDTEQRVAILGPRPTPDVQDVVTRYMHWLRVSLWVIMPALVGILAAAFVSILVRRWLAVLTVFAVCVIGMVHGLFLAIQGGLLVSPIGIAQSLAIPVLASQALLVTRLGSPREIGRSALYWLPFAVFVLGACLGEVRSAELSDDAVRGVLNIVFRPMYLWAYIATVIFGIISFLGRGGQRAAPDVVSQVPQAHASGP